MALTYEGIVGAILDYYEPGSPIFERIVTGAATPAEVYNAYSYIPQMEVVKSVNGSVLGIDYAEPLIGKLTVAEDIASGFDSNVGAGGYSGGGSFTGNVPSFVTVDQTGNPIAITGAKTAAGATLATVADKLNLAVAGVSLGAKLGKAIDQGLYNLAPDWWDEHFPYVNPDTWADIAGESEVGKFFLRTLLGVNTDGSTVPYLDERILAYYYQMMRDEGAWSSGGQTIDIINPTYQTYTVNRNILITQPSIFAPWGYETIPSLHTVAISNNISPVYCSGFYYGDNNVEWLFYSKNPFTISSSLNANANNPSTYQSSAVTIGGQTFYHFHQFSYASNFANTNIRSLITNLNQFLVEECSTPNGIFYLTLEYILLFQSEIYDSPSIDGITDLSGATHYPPTNITGTTTEEVLQQLKQQYPQLFDGSITSSVLQPDGTTKTITYVPVPYPTDTPTDKSQPVTPPDTTQDPTIDPDSDTLPTIIGGTDTGDGTTTPPTDPPTTGTGDGPTPVLPTGQASSLWAVYNPTQAQLNLFGAWLWSSDFVDQLKRLFNDPMQAIIGVHKVFATPSTGASQNIKCGYLDSGVPSAVVTSQYTEVDCGTVKLSEYFGNVFDYAPHTRVSAYLPFIGVVPLDVADIMRASINISYGVDVITGACLAKIKVTRDNAGGIIYSFGGSCAVHYPVSSGSYSGIISAGLSAATGILGTALTGNPMSAVTGIAGAIRSAHTDVQKGGGFTGASGACGPKKPYLIISRPQTKMADNFPGIDGYPANHTTTLSQCSGYIRCKEVHLNSGAAYGAELSEIESLLKTGILI